MLKIEKHRTIADLIESLGVPPQRILLHPPPGTATEQDVLDFDDHEDRLVELIDGVLVEKAMGFEESVVGICIATLLRNFIRPRNLGIVAGSDGMVRYRPGCVQMADVAFFSWDRFPNRELPGDAISRVTPDLAIEILSKSNTEAEMERKRREYFQQGATLVWLVDHKQRTVRVYTSVEAYTTLDENDSIDGGNVLLGFQVVVREFFADLTA